MSMFVCGVCGHIEFGEAPEHCPVCHAPKTAFEAKDDAVSRPENPDALTDGDKKHIPVIVVNKECGLIPGGGCRDVHVKVGEIEHVMQAEHYIAWIDYYVDKKFAARVELMPELCHAAAGLHLNVSAGTVTAIEHCNVHGTWMSEAVI